MAIGGGLGASWLGLLTAPSLACDSPSFLLSESIDGPRMSASVGSCSSEQPAAVGDLCISPLSAEDRVRLFAGEEALSDRGSGRACGGPSGSSELVQLSLYLVLPLASDPWPGLPCVCPARSRGQKTRKKQTQFLTYVSPSARYNFSPMFLTSSHICFTVCTIQFLTYVSPPARYNSSQKVLTISHICLTVCTVPPPSCTGFGAMTSSAYTIPRQPNIGVLFV